ncbi:MULTISPECIES: VOC family protein [Halorussus]|uniref:VOC family protein n=1 Tax=Halorussus TaxID=1070314 RepID=UPI00209E2C19|nr:VOC family protein [Halorussus vallis]USZ75960.1 VOC family protein [Halorussus vallis]
MAELPDVRVDHVGIAVESVADAEPLLELLGAERLVYEDDPTGAFRWAYYLLGDASRVELVEPVPGEESFLTDFLDARGPGLHHVTLEVADIDATIEALEAEGIGVVDRTEYDAWVEAFVSPRNPTGVLFQLMEYRAPFEEGRVGPERLYVGGERLSAEE